MNDETGTNKDSRPLSLVGQLTLALAKAQAEIAAPARNREVKVATKSGSTYSFRYATLDAVIDVVRGPLTKNGLWFVQILEGGADGKYRLVTRLLHESGESIESVTPLLVQGTGNQEFGSALTYMRRYALTALLGVAADEDDDANRADGNTVEQSRERKPAAWATAVRGAREPAAQTTAEGDAMISEIAGSQSLEDLGLWGNDPDVKAKIGALPRPEQDRVRRAYAARHASL